jgi:hypothetical protein
MKMSVVELIKRHRDIGLQDDPQFNKARKRHDWRNYIPDDVRSLWKEMSVEARVISFFVAEKRANAENWD